MNYARLKSLASDRGLSLAYLSTSVGMSRFYLASCERDGTRISDEKESKIASLLGTTVAYLNDETDDPEPNDAELLGILDELRNDPERRMLFHTLEGCTKEDILLAIKIIEALKK